MSGHQLNPGLKRTLSLPGAPATGPPMPPGLQPAAELSVPSDGTTARVTGASVNGEYDKAALQQIPLGLFAYGTPAV